MTIKFIQFPHVITEDGQGVLIADCVNQPRVGDRIEFNEELQLYKVFKSNDTECTNGACGLDKLE